MPKTKAANPLRPSAPVERTVRLRDEMIINEEILSELIDTMRLYASDKNGQMGIEPAKNIMEKWDEYAMKIMMPNAVLSGKPPSTDFDNTKRLNGGLSA